MRSSWALIFAAVILGGGQVACAEEVMDVSSRAVKTLAAKGLKCGFNSKSNIWVAIGVSVGEMNPNAGAGFQTKRNNLHKIAYLNAQRRLVRSMGVRMSAKSEMRTSGDRNVALQELRELSEAFAQRVLCGCVVLCAEEEWRNGELSVAMAVGVSKDAKGQIATKEANACGEMDEDWRQWLAGEKLGTLSGSRQFRDSRGRIRRVGIGLADVQGLSGETLVNALDVAQIQAVQSLAFAMYADVAIKEVLEKGMASTEADSVAWERFSYSVIQRCSIYTPPCVEVFDGDVVCPLTGRKLHMTICGN